MAGAAQSLSRLKRLALDVGVLLALAGCAATAPSPGAPHGRDAGSSSPPPDASYDWHGLAIMPLGTLLKSSPTALREVLLFHDDAQPAAASPGPDCYTVDGQPPLFLGHPAADYLLCFQRDRLDKIEASVDLPAPDAESSFAWACALWRKNGMPPADVLESCSGQDGGMAFDARFTAAHDAAVAHVSIVIFPAVLP